MNFEIADWDPKTEDKFTASIRMRREFQNQLLRYFAVGTPTPEPEEQATEYKGKGRPRKTDKR